MNITHHMVDPDVIMVYGFEDGKPEYAFVATMTLGYPEPRIHGLMSRKRLVKQDLDDIAKYIQALAPTSFITFEVLKHHWPAWEPHLKVWHIENTHTFNGYESVTVTVTYKEV